MKQLTFIEVESTPKPVKAKPETEDQQIDRLVEDAIAQCNQQGVNPEELLFYLQLRHLWDSYLSRIPVKKQMEFAVRLIRIIEGERNA